MTGAVTPPGVLICAGLDPSGGAGLIADVRVAAALGTRPVGVVTATTVQNTTGAIAQQPLDPEHVREQLEFLLSDVEVHAVKLGMLGAPELAVAIGEALALTRAPVVWDPVLRASRGPATLGPGLERAVAALAPHLALITPNVDELAVLAGAPVPDAAAALEAGRALARRLDVAVLVKAGHLATAAAADVLCRPTGELVLDGPRVAGGDQVHGTGCALSTAIAAHLARGAALDDACRAAKAYVHDRIADPVHPGRGAAAVV